MKSGIYIIKNTLDGKIYIGSALIVEYRWRVHKSLLHKNKHHSIHLQNSWNKYGKDAFEFKLIEEVFEPTNLIWREQFYLDYYQSYKSEKGYNIRSIADSCLGVKWRQESKNKMLGNKNQAGRICSLETREKLRQANLGSIRSDEAKENMRKAQLDLYSRGYINPRKGKILNKVTRKYEFRLQK